MKRELLIAQFLATPWAMQPERLSAVAGLLARWRSGAGASEATLAAVAEAKSAAARKNSGKPSGSIAVLPLYGVITQRSSMVDDVCGPTGTSTQAFLAAFRDAMEDETVGTIIIDIDSPGGSVYGVSELASEIAQAAKSKRVVAFANSLAASAAYWIGCAAGEFYVTPGGEVGSIGVWQAHEDWSKAMEQSGVDVTLISAGQYKVEGNPYEPLTDDAKAFLQSRVDDYYTMFTKAVAKGRGVPIDAVRNGMGQGRVLGADEALAEKMVDGIKTFDEVVAMIRKDSTSSQTSAKADALPGVNRLAAAKRELFLL
ncbi:S49 family peptidase [Chitinimonas sp.]|uniref:S49 family peptidase n=1 Tax=Chitinimonas sp. TaxID=1934313 RepID=UPI0035B2D55C